jgi:hypothetical protein
MGNLAANRRGTQEEPMKRYPVDTHHQNTVALATADLAIVDGGTAVADCPPVAARPVLPVPVIQPPVVVAPAPVYRPFFCGTPFYGPGWYW